MTEHRIESGPRFVHGQPSDDAPMTCTCGEAMAAGEFRAHRISVGLESRGISDGRRGLGEPNVWRSEYRRNWASR